MLIIIYTVFYTKRIYKNTDKVVTQGLEPFGVAVCKKSNFIAVIKKQKAVKNSVSYAQIYTRQKAGQIICLLL